MHANIHTYAYAVCHARNTPPPHLPAYLLTLTTTTTTTPHACQLPYPILHLPALATANGCCHYQLVTTSNGGGELQLVVVARGASDLLEQGYCGGAAAAGAAAALAPADCGPAKAGRGVWLRRRRPQLAGVEEAAAAAAADAPPPAKVPFSRLLLLNRPEWPYLLLGTAARCAGSSIPHAGGVARARAPLLAFFVYVHA